LNSPLPSICYLVQKLKKELTTELVKTKVLNISLVAVVGIVDSVDNPNYPQNTKKLETLLVDNF